MPYIAYQKYIDSTITRELRLPEDAQTRLRLGAELATVDGITYVFLPAGTTLPGEQPSEIAESIRVVILDQPLRKAIKAASPYCRLINQRVTDKIRTAYSASDEFGLLRTAPSPALEEYSAFVDSCRAWGREQKSLIGL